MADRNPMGPYCSEISIDFNNVIAKADELEEVADKLNEQSLKILEDWNGIALWNGSAADSFKHRLLFFSIKIKAEAARLKTLAGIIRFVAETLKKVEEKAKDIFKPFNHGGGGRGR